MNLIDKEVTNVTSLSIHKPAHNKKLALVVVDLVIEVLCIIFNL
jgi:hypothetical protein